MRDKSKRACIHVYTGEGKGKTTSAFGLALRAWGHGKKVCVIQFMKKDTGYGEYKASLKLGRRFLVRQFGPNKFIKCVPTLRDKETAEKGLKYSIKAIICGKYDLVVLDEINCAMHWGLLSEKSVKEIIKIKPLISELVLTGRFAPRWLLKKADLVTEMNDKKHYFNSGLKARCGIEY